MSLLRIFPALSLSAVSIVLSGVVAIAGETIRVCVPTSDGGYSCGVRSPSLISQGFSVADPIAPIYPYPPERSWKYMGEDSRGNSIYVDLFSTGIRDANGDPRIEYSVSHRKKSFIVMGSVKQCDDPIARAIETTDGRFFTISTHDIGMNKAANWACDRNKR